MADDVLDAATKAQLMRLVNQVQELKDAVRMLVAAQLTNARFCSQSEETNMEDVSAVYEAFRKKV